MNVLIDQRVAKFIKKLNRKEAAKATEYIELFKEFGFALDQRYLKKVNQAIWELRPGSIRLYLFVKSENQVIIHAIRKKSQKITKKDIEVIRQRMKDYL